MASDGDREEQHPGENLGPEKRPGLARRLWRWFWTPSVALSAGLLLVVGAGAGAIALGSFNKVMEATNTLEFCISCHEMRDNVYEEYKKTVHYSNASGVRAVCSDCHVPHAWLPKVKRKIEAAKEVYHHLAGTIGTPEKFEEHRAALAQRVWNTMEANDSAQCRTCHSFEAMDFSKQSPKASKVMQEAHLTGEQTCISCHKGIAHKMPDLSSGYKKTWEEIQRLAQQLPADADTLYTISTEPVYLSAAAVKDGGRGVGTLLPATEVTVLERDRDAVKVRLDGWQQDGADRVIYALMGQRIFEGAFRPEAIEAIQRHDTMVDPNTDLTWHQVSVDLWLPPKGLIADPALLWEYGEEMHAASCATCHSLHLAGEHLANQWIGVLDSMERYLTLDKEQTRMLQKYLQMHASDVPETAREG